MTQDCSHSPFTATVGNPFTKGIASSGLKNVSAQKVEGTPFPKQHFNDVKKHFLSEFSRL